ncbi:hypothetical protein H6F90_08180 [Trichocoleus sp. FACHB-591]|uniref:hypothetical protein n=1 Tax=Trichocoleus TaxID=450526 RepID=UPI0016883CD1|nr:hypothetical protein [Trichocoleus sp. FACHB-591]MBD2095131.1 hypothetical protein [Trichocoleus sp. FACHB-591]
MKFDLGLAGFLFSVFTASVGWLLGWLTNRKQNQALAKQKAQIEREQTAEAVKKEYAAERDFAHLRRNQEQMIQNIGVLMKDFDDRADKEHNELWQKFEALHRELLEIKAMLRGQRHPE